MKQLIMILALAVASLTTYAQGNHEGKTAEERATHYTEWVNKKVTLTAEQLSQVKAINLEAATKMDEAKNTADRKEKMDKVKAIQEERDTKLKAVLTPEQWAKYETAKAEKKEDMKEKREERKSSKMKEEPVAPATPAAPATPQPSGN